MPKICLILAAISLVGCNKYPEFPKDVHKYALDMHNSKCHEFLLIDAEKQLYKPTQSFPLEKCNGYFAASPEDEIKIKNWVKDMIAWVKAQINGN